MQSTDAPQRQPTAFRVVSELRWVALGRVASQISWNAMVVVLAALLPPQAFGTVAAGVAIVSVATLIMQSGTGGSIIAAREVSWRQARNAAIANLGLGVVLTAIIAVGAGPLVALIAEGGNPDVLRVLAISVLILALSVVPTALIRKAMLFKRLAGVTVFASVLTALSAIGAALLGAGVWALVVRQVLFNLLVAVFTWIAARDLVRELRASDVRGPAWLPPRGRLSFLLISASGLLALSIDNVVVGASTDATTLGFYALAFMLAFAPLTQLSWQLGSVLFPAAAATTDLQTLGNRTVRIIRVVAVILFPLVSPAIALAPVVLPAVFGPEWRPMVLPFQILILVGISHSVHNIIGESLSGSGSVGFRARCETIWAVSTVIMVLLLVNVAGILGAALAHLVAFLPLAATYSVSGMRRIGSSARKLWAGVRDLVLAVALQGAVTATMVMALDRAGATAGFSAAIASAVGLAVVASALRVAPSRPFDDVRTVVRMARSRAAPGAASD